MDEDKAERPWLEPDELEVVRTFLRAGVRFLIVGGRAVQFHGHARPAKDLDLLVEPTAENWPKLQAALRPLNAGVPPYEDLSPQRKYQAKLQFYETVEILTAITGVRFADAWSESIEATFAGLRVRVLSKAHLILSKLESHRSADADDVRHLGADIL
jgi:hypothetical protein